MINLFEEFEEQKYVTKLPPIFIVNSRIGLKFFAIRAYHLSVHSRLNAQYEFVSASSMTADLDMFL